VSTRFSAEPLLMADSSSAMTDPTAAMRRQILDLRLRSGTWTWKGMRNKL
jgi:hypothetical protein